MQYHQQLEQENETKRFQQMLNRNQATEETKLNNARGTNNKNEDVDESLKIWYGISNSTKKHEISLFSFIIALILTVY